MGNGLQNAGGLDGVTGFAGNGGAIAVEENGWGGPGRGVITELGTAGAGGGAVVIYSSQIPVTSGKVMECAGRFGAPGATSDLKFYLEVIDDGGAQLQVTPIPVASAGQGAPRRGLPASFSAAYGRIPIVFSGQARLHLHAPFASAGSVKAGLYRPFLNFAPAGPSPTRWDPGAHINPDLQLSIWPSILPPFLADGPTSPVPNAKAFATDSGIPIREDLYSDLRQEFRARMRCSAEQYDAVEDFYATERDEFFVVRPDTDQLCFAEWLSDGAPKPVEIRGPWTIVEVGMQLRLA